MNCDSCKNLYHHVTHIHAQVHALLRAEFDKMQARVRMDLLDKKSNKLQVIVDLLNTTVSGVTLDQFIEILSLASCVGQSLTFVPTH